MKLALIDDGKRDDIFLTLLGIKKSLTGCVNEKRTPLRCSFSIVLFFFKWCHSESNQGHTDFQSVALPTELWHPFIFGVTKVNIFSKPQSFFFSNQKMHEKSLQPRLLAFRFLFILLQADSSFNG